MERLLFPDDIAIDGDRFLESFVVSCWVFRLTGTDIWKDHYFLLGIEIDIFEKTVASFCVLRLTEIVIWKNVVSLLSYLNEINSPK